MDTVAIRRQLNLVRIIAIADGVLLVVLVIAAITGSSAVHVLGPIHGVGFLVLLFLVTRGAGEGKWGWWFPLIVLVTAGPPGSLYGDVRIRRALPA